MQCLEKKTKSNLFLAVGLRPCKLHVSEEEHAHRNGEHGNIVLPQIPVWECGPVPDAQLRGEETLAGYAVAVCIKKNFFMKTN